MTEEQAQSAVISEEQPQNSVEDAEESTASKILKQVEFYFSDSNLPHDKFLWELTQQKDGWVSIAQIASFKRMKALETDVSKIAEALRKSLELLEVNEDGTLLRRRKPLIEKRDLLERSIYAKNFPDETPTLQDDIENMFSEHGKVLSIRMRRDDAKKFKKSVFVEFQTVEEAEHVAAMKLQYDNTDLLVMTKRAYIDMKTKEYKDNPEKAKQNNHRRRPFDAFKQGQKQSSNSTATKEPEVHFNKVNTLIAFRTENDQTNREDVRDVVNAQAAVKWVEFERGKTEGIILLADSVASEVLPKLADAKVGDLPVEFYIPDETASTGFWETNEERIRNHGKIGGSRGGRSGGGRGGYKGYNRGGRRNNNNRGQKRKLEEGSSEGGIPKVTKASETSAPSASVSASE